MIGTYLDRQSNIYFSQVYIPTIYTGMMYSKGQYDLNGSIIQSQPDAFINSLDIDWNGAYLPSLNKFIYTTGDLLHQIDYIYSVIKNGGGGNSGGGSGNIDIDLSEYVKRQELINFASKESFESLQSNIENNYSTTAQIEELLNNLNTIYANKDVESSISSLQEELSNKVNASQLSNYASIVWVNNQFSTYAKTPYDVYKANGGTKTETEWLASLQGKDGTNGRSAYQIAKDYNPYIGDEYTWINSLQGKDGLSAYQIAKDNDPSIGTQEEWIESLKGEKGDTGDDGKSAYQIAVDNGFIGDIDEWIKSLKGKDGDKGEKGDPGVGVNILGYYDTLNELYSNTFDTINSIGDAYNIAGEIYIYNDNYNSNVDSISDKWKWAGQFKGERGDDGKSAYQVAVDNGFTGNEEEWLESLHVNTESIQYGEGNGIDIVNNNISINVSELWKII